MAEVAVKTKPSLYTPSLKRRYQEEIRPRLQKKLELNNLHEVPSIEKIVVSAGLGRAQDDKKLLEIAANTIAKITGQKPIQTTAKKSIASFKLREGSKVGLKVTLRGARMFEFADRFINLVLPRLRDFHGVSRTAFDRQGNFSIGLADQSVFPELTFEDIATLHGLQVIFVIKSAGPEHSKLFLEELGMPFQKEAKGVS